ncbi:cyclic nucleotide-binding domain protein [Bacteriovorax sp. BAL6_X]|uniref:Crp/Fnr family transcriptional regulator n=1 Tax=Bacteriovorax sp. BAL6_X TaxID=1201290 RepID=UPI000386CDB6|nr:Crp/Fnr family transcriptional regulator [Bacteriovorax sp. BAL6_X]EPZ51030.1 cyclic nucleotide-binding domain protein [Bacteriovorax sp. BAL6_X]
MIKEILNNIERPIFRQYQKGQAIYRELEAPQFLYIVEEGIIGLYYNSENGKESFLRVYGPGEIFGHRSYFLEEPYHANSISLTKSKLMLIDRKQCDKICLQSPDLLKNMTKILARELGNAERRLARMADKSAKARIVEALVYLKLKHPEHHWTRKEVADFAVSTFESVTRILKELELAGLITKSGRSIEIIDEQKLLKYSIENY